MKFLEPPYEHHSNHRYKDHTNGAVNLGLVKVIKKGREAYYPDNQGIPTLVFSFGPKDEQVWYLNSETDQTVLYDLLTNGVK